MKNSGIIVNIQPSAMKGQINVKKFLKAAALAGGALCLLKGLDNRLEVTHYNISSEKIPSDFNNFKILQVSDFHADNVPGLVTEIKNEMPDIIVSTGDLADDKGSFLPSVRLCEHLVDIAPVYAVTGNHDLWRADYEEFERITTNIGVKTLRSERVTLNRGSSEIALYGIDDPFSRKSVRASANIKTAISKLERCDSYEILLFHRANLFDYIKNYAFDLVIAGHMHGGQVRLPTGQGLVSPRSSWVGQSSIMFPKYVGGHYHAPHSDMIVSRGIGNPMLIPRLFNRPELTVITLHSEDIK